MQLSLMHALPNPHLTSVQTTMCDEYVLYQQCNHIHHKWWFVCWLISDSNQDTISACIWTIAYSYS